MSNQKTINEATDAQQPDGEPLGLSTLLGGLPELTEAERIAMNGLPADAVDHWWLGEKWNGEKWVSNIDEPPKDGPVACRKCGGNEFDHRCQQVYGIGGPYMAGSEHHRCRVCGAMYFRGEIDLPFVMD